MGLGEARRSAGWREWPGCGPVGGGTGMGPGRSVGAKGWANRGETDRPGCGKIGYIERATDRVAAESARVFLVGGTRREGAAQVAGIEA